MTTVTTKRRKAYIPSRRSAGKVENRRLGSKVFSYYTNAERELLDEAAAHRRRSLSSFVAEATLAAAKEEIPDWRKRWPELAE